MLFCLFYLLTGITWTDTTKKSAFRWEHEGAFEDLDGTLTGTAGAKVVPSNPSLDPSVCTEDDEWSAGSPRGSICDTDKPFHRYAWNNVSFILYYLMYYHIVLSYIYYVFILSELLQYVYINAVCELKVHQLLL